MAEEELDLSFLENDEEKERKTPKPEELGYALRKEQKARKDAEKQLAELVKFRDDQLAKARTEALKSAGLSEGQAKYFQGDVTPESIEAYKVDLGITTKVQETEEEAADQSREAELLKRPAFQPTVTGTAVAPAAISAAELAKILKTDPARADKLVAEGKVALETEL